MRYLPRHTGRFATLLVAVLLVVITAMAQQKGKASYYSKRSHGARTSSGVRLNNDSLFCAHKSYDFGTLLLVRNPANGKEVVVKVVDRGPHSKGRIIDITYEAARQLGIVAQGVAVVEVSKYDNTAIPYKPKNYELPELNLEIQERPDYHDKPTPVWQKTSQAVPQQHKDSLKQQKHTAPQQQTVHNHKHTAPQQQTVHNQDNKVKKNERIH